MTCARLQDRGRTLTETGLGFESVPGSLAPLVGNFLAGR
jgi:hypothetical protein